MRPRRFRRSSRPGPSATTLHYDECNRQVQAGELLLLDIGAEVEGYAADVTRTIPVSGQFSPEQRAIYTAVLRAQQCGIAAAKPGATLAVHAATVASVQQSLLELGLITDATGDQYRLFFMHGTSHYVGARRARRRQPHDPLAPGMVITVEPGIYVRADALITCQTARRTGRCASKVRPAFERFKNIGVRLEDDVLVTGQGCRVMSERAPRTIDEVERHGG
ncbi:MAG: M24 family metallopeptidase [Planctomycetota bacterium]